MNVIQKRGYLYDADEMAECATARPEPLPPEHTPERATPADLERLAGVYAGKGCHLTAGTLQLWADELRGRAA